MSKVYSDSQYCDFDLKWTEHGISAAPYYQCPKCGKILNDPHEALEMVRDQPCKPTIFNMLAKALGF